MKLTLNRDYAFRHLAVAALLGAVAVWSVYDGAVKYPADNRAWEAQAGTTVEAALADEHRAKDQMPPHAPYKINEQFYQAGILALAALVIAGLVGLEARKTLAWDEKEMNGSLTCGKPLPFAEVKSCDWSKWESKRIVAVHAADGRAVKLDAWHHAGVTELAKLLPAKK